MANGFVIGTIIDPERKKGDNYECVSFGVLMKKTVTQFDVFAPQPNEKGEVKNDPIYTACCSLKEGDKAVCKFSTTHSDKGYERIFLRGIAKVDPAYVESFQNLFKKV